MSRPDDKYYDAAVQRPCLIQRVCAYFRHGDECEGCPEWEDSAYGTCKRMCRALAEEVIALVVEDFEVRQPGEIKQDNGRR